MRVAFQTLGCRSNFADTLELQAALSGLGATPVETLENADVIVVNSCSVTDEADRETLKTIRRARGQNLEARVIVTGCMAEVAKERLLGTGMVDGVLGPADKTSILKVILDSKPPSSITNSLAQQFNPHHVGPSEKLGEVRTRSRFHLRVQDGCENHCTFCIVPSTRGELRSRDCREVIRDLHELRTRGFREVVLSGTHLGGWGEENGKTLLTLLRLVEQELGYSGLRVRLSSLDPNNLSHEIIDLVGQSHIFCKHLHICVQALSERVLKRMNRRYSLREAVELLNYVAASYPGITIGSDIITGFPGETREEVAEQLELFDALPLSYLHVFPYSERQETAALRLPGNVDPGERRRRAARWRAVAERRWSNYLRGFIGRELSVIVESGSVESMAKGTSDQYLPTALYLPQDSVYRFGAKDSTERDIIAPGAAVRAIAREVIGAVQRSQSDGASSGENGERVVCELLSLES